VVTGTFLAIRAPRAAPAPPSPFSSPPSSDPNTPRPAGKPSGGGGGGGGGIGVSPGGAEEVAAVEETLGAWAARQLQRPVAARLEAAVTVVHALALAANSARQRSAAWRAYTSAALAACNAFFAAALLLRAAAARGSLRAFLVSRTAVAEFLLTASGVGGLLFAVPVLSLLPALRVYRLLALFPTSLEARPRPRPHRLLMPCAVRLAWRQPPS